MAPAGQPHPDERKPSKVMRSVNIVPVDGSVIVSELSGPFEVLVPVIVTIDPVPAGMRVGLNDVVPVTCEFSPPTTCVSLAVDDCGVCPGTTTVPVTRAVAVVPVTRLVPAVRRVARWARFTAIDPAVPLAVSDVPVDAVKITRTPVTVVGSTPAGSAALASGVPTIHAPATQASTWIRSAPCGKVTAPKEAKFTASKRLFETVVDEGFVGSTSVRLSARALEELRVVRTSDEASPTLNCVVAGVQSAVVAVLTE